MQFVKNYLFRSSKQEQFEQLEEEATSFYEAKEYEKSLDKYLESLEFCDDVLVKGNVFNRIGIIFDKLQSFEESLTFFRKALNIALKNDDERAANVARQNISHIEKKLKKKSFLSSILHSVEAVERGVETSKIMFFTSLRFPFKLRIRIIGFIDTSLIVTPRERVENMIPQFFGHINNSRTIHLIFRNIELRGNFSGRNLQPYIPIGIRHLILNGKFQDCVLVHSPSSVASITFRSNPCWSDSLFKDLVTGMKNLKKIAIYQIDPPSEVLPWRLLKSPCFDKVESIEGINIPLQTIQNACKKLENTLRSLTLDFEVYDGFKSFSRSIRNMKCLQQLKLDGFLVGLDEEMFRNEKRGRNHNHTHFLMNLQVFEYTNSVHMKVLVNILENTRIKKVTLNVNCPKDVVIESKFPIPIKQKEGKTETPGTKEEETEEDFKKQNDPDLKNQFLEEFEACDGSVLDYQFYSFLLNSCSKLNRLSIPFEKIDKLKLRYLIHSRSLTSVKLENHPDLHNLRINPRITTLHVICKENINKFPLLLQHIKYLTVERNRNLHYNDYEISFTSRMFANTKIRSISFINFKFTHEQRFLKFIKENTEILELYYRRYKWTRDLK